MKQFQYLVPLLIFSLFSCGDNQTTDIRDEVDPTPEVTLVENSQDKELSLSKEETGIYDNYENTGRVIWQKLDEVIEMMGDLSDKTVADIGAGDGHFSIPLAQKAQKVISIDINKQMITKLDSLKNFLLPEEFQSRLTARLTTENNPGLEKEEADIVIIVNTLTWVSDRVSWLKKVKTGLKPGGKIYIIDFKKKRIPLKVTPVSYRIPLYIVENEMEIAGFSKIESNDAVLDYQYIVVAEKVNKEKLQ